MINPDYLRAMAAYNTAMNERLYAAAQRLPDAERRRDCGGFWRSIHGTFSHLIWADCMWMSRFAGWHKPGQDIAASGDLFESFSNMAAARTLCDAGLVTWAETVDHDWLAGSQSWFSGAAHRNVTAPRTLLVAHLFNHQTHHRGQVHAMLTAAGETTGDTDLWLVLEEDRASGRNLQHLRLGDAEP